MTNCKSVGHPTEIALPICANVSCKNGLITLSIDRPVVHPSEEQIEQTVQALRAWWEDHRPAM